MDAPKAAPDADDASAVPTHGVNGSGSAELDDDGSVEMIFRQQLEN